MRIWLDCANSPHPLFFAPIARRLEEQGHEVLVTARDNAQTVDLAQERFQSVAVIGGASPAAVARKGAQGQKRVLELRRWARGRKIGLALSHNSYTQLAASRSLGLRTITSMDFEHQPANHLAFRLAHRILLPEALRASPVVARQGAAARKTTYYQGLKEELYLGDFEPDPQVLTSLGLGADGKLIAVARTPPTGALYHRSENPEFVAALRVLAAAPDVALVVLPRQPEQRRMITDLSLAGAIVPDHTIDSRSLLYEADVFLGAGGTMTREAALLGIPTFSVFSGKRGAVDRLLEARGLVRRLERVDDVLAAPERGRVRVPLPQLRERRAALLAVFVDAVNEGRRACGGRLRPLGGA